MSDVNKKCRFTEIDEALQRITNGDNIHDIGTIRAILLGIKHGCQRCELNEGAQCKSPCKKREDIFSRANTFIVNHWETYWKLLFKKGA